jgi:hypothetical protein
MAVYFLWHWLWAHAPQVLPGTLPFGARTFLRTHSNTATVRPTPQIKDNTNAYSKPLIKVPPPPGDFDPLRRKASQRIERMPPAQSRHHTAC